MNKFQGDVDACSTVRSDDATKAQVAASVPLKRIGEAEEVAEAIVFLASRKASFITGESLAIDGGKVAR